MKTEKKRVVLPPEWVSTASWLQLNEELKVMSEKEAWDMLQHEGSTYARKSYLRRLYYRYSLLRRRRELETLDGLSATTHRGH